MHRGSMILSSPRRSTPALRTSLRSWFLLSSSVLLPVLHLLSVTLTLFLGASCSAAFWTTHYWCCDSESACIRFFAITCAVPAVTVSHEEAVESLSRLVGVWLALTPNIMFNSENVCTLQAWHTSSEPLCSSRFIRLSEDAPPATESSGFICHSPGQPARQNLWSTPWGFRFLPAGAVTKINDLIFVVLAEWQQLYPGWLTLSAVCHSWRSPLPFCQIALILRSWLPLGHPCAPSLLSKVFASSGPAALFTSHGVRTCKAMSKCAERIPRILLLSPGGLSRCWVPGREGRGARGNRLQTQQLALLWSLSLPTAINQTVWLFSMAAT